MELKYCPNGECVNFQEAVETNTSRCPMCAWELVPVKKQADRADESRSNREDEAA